MEKKGVSPVIATILLVGMVIALALIVFVWMQTFTQEAITKFEGQNVELVCADVEIQADLQGNQLAVFNSGQVPIYDLRIKISSAEKQETYSAREMGGLQTGLNQGGSWLGTISASSSADVLLVPILLGESEEGRKIYACPDETGLEL